MNHSPRPTRPNTAYRFFTTLFLALAALLLSACATTETAETGLSATGSSARQYFFFPSDGRYFGTSIARSGEFIRQTTAQAEKGEAAAQYELGLILLERKDADSRQKAFEMIKKAAQAGYSPAEVYLGTMYRNGEGVKKDRDEAIRQYHIAIAKGSAWAMFEMGSLLYERPHRDTPQALAWFKKAAQAGHPMAQTAYGVFLLEGKDLPEDAVNGERYVIKAAESGDAFSQFSLAVLYLRGMHFEENLDAAQVWMTRSAEKNYVPAIDLLPWIMYRKERKAMQIEAPVKEGISE